jgi:hypothetical protein
METVELVFNLGDDVKKFCDNLVVTDKPNEKDFE